MDSLVLVHVNVLHIALVCARALSSFDMLIFYLKLKPYVLVSINCALENKLWFDI